MTKAVFDGIVIAESDRVRRLEGIAYFPADSVDMSRLIATPTITRCFWKGKATYFSVEGESDLAIDAAFRYEEPWPLARKLVGDRIGFWREIKII